MVFTRAQLDTLSREEFVEELIKCSNIADQIKTLTEWFDEFVGKYEKSQSELVISKNCSSLLVNHIINLERDALSNAQYEKRNAGDESCSSFNKQFDLEENVCKALYLTGTRVKLDDLDACHRMKKK